MINANTIIDEYKADISKERIEPVSITRKITESNINKAITNNIAITFDIIPLFIFLRFLSSKSTFP